MTDYILLMHDDTTLRDLASREEAWTSYLTRLRETGAFRGGSEIGEGECLRKQEKPPGITQHLGGYILVQAKDLAAAKSLVTGNPVYEAGGTVEIRELPRS